MAEAAETFWRFSLALYAAPGVAPACIALQDRHGRDVNLMLYACWLGAAGRGRMSARDFARAEAIAAPWRREVIGPLRAARRAFKGDADAQYAETRAAELAAERVAQARLAGAAPAAVAAKAAAERLADAEANLALYLDDPAARQIAAPLFAALAGMAARGLSA